MAVEAQIRWDNYSKQPHMVASWDSIGAQLYRWTITMEFRYTVSWPSPEQLSLVRVQFEPVSGHPATNIDVRWCTPWAEWLPWWCLHGSNTGTTLQLRVIGKREKSDTVSVYIMSALRKVSHVMLRYVTSVLGNCATWLPPITTSNLLNQLFCVLWVITL